MGLTALDYSSAISGADLVAATRDDIHKIDTVARYITDPDLPKSLSAAEYADLRAHGFTVLLLDEQEADYMVAGHWAGFAGGRARASARRARAEQIGAAGTIFYSLDIDATPAQIDIALEFLAGAHSVDPGRVGAYGEYEFVKAAADSGYPIFGTIAWSGGRRDPRAIAWQLDRQITIAGVVCDIDDLNPNPATGGSASTPEDDMATFATGQITTGADTLTLVCVPPPNYGSAHWGNVWFSLGSANGDAHVRVSAYIHGKGWQDLASDFQVTDHADRADPAGGPLPVATQKIAVSRLPGSEDVPLSWLIEAVMA